MKVFNENKDVKKICDIVINHLNKINKDFYITQIEFYSKSRKREVKEARQIAMYFSNLFLNNKWKKSENVSIATIGNNIGDRDHATVLHGCRFINNLIETEIQFRKTIGDIEKLIQAKLITLQITEKEKTDAIINGLCSLLVRKTKQKNIINHKNNLITKNNICIRANHNFKKETA